MSLLSSIQGVNPLVSSESYYTLIESHLEYLRNHPRNRILEVTPHEADVFMGDLAGLLKEKMIAAGSHYAIIRMNGYASSMAYDGIATHFIIPDDSVLSRIMNSFTSEES